MHVLISICNRKADGLPILALVDAESLELSVVALPDSLPSFNGITGLAADANHIYAVIGLHSDGVPSALLIFDRRDFRLLNYYYFRMVLDAHSLCVQGDSLFVVSTGKNEIVRLHLKGCAVVSEEAVWRLDPDGPRKDIHHLNAICLKDGNLIASGFGRRDSDRWSSAGDGFIINTVSGDKLVTGIDQPHSVSMIDGELAYCASQQAKLHLGDRSASIPGYSRGLCRTGSHIFVGTSFGRRVSKSDGVVNNPAEQGESTGRCGIFRFDAVTLAPTGECGLENCAREFYDLLPVDDVSRWPIVPAIQWRDAALRALFHALDKQITITAALSKKT